MILIYVTVRYVEYASVVLLANELNVREEQQKPGKTGVAKTVGFFVFLFFFFVYTVAFSSVGQQRAENRLGKMD